MQRQFQFDALSSVFSGSSQLISSAGCGVLFSIEGRQHSGCDNRLAVPQAKLVAGENGWK
jgi:hypothetical protein